jgi:glycine C-acetyltransferase
MSTLEQKVNELKTSGVYRELPVNEGPCEAIIRLNGKM